MPLDRGANVNTARMPPAAASLVVPLGSQYPAERLVRVGWRSSTGGVYLFIGARATTAISS
jgi:hypothetical protein